MSGPRAGGGRTGRSVTRRQILLAGGAVALGGLVTACQDEPAQRADLTPAAGPGLRAPVTVDDLPADGLWSAHRGGGNSPFLAPDGSLSAYRLALELGAHIIDLDVHTTADGVLVALHDDTLDRTTSGSGPVAALPYRALPPIDMRDLCGPGWAPEPVPSIEQVLAEFGGRVVLTIEAKDGLPSVAPLADLIVEHGLQRSVLINTADPVVAQAVSDAGCLAHVYRCATVAAVSAADAAGAWLIEVPADAAPEVVAAARNAANIQRVIAGPVFRRIELAMMTEGIQGYVSDALGYLDRVEPGTSIAPQLATRRIGAGWYRDTDTQPVFDDDGVVVASAAGVVTTRLGTLCGPKPGSYRVTVTVLCSDVGVDPGAGVRIRLCCPSDEGTGADTDTRGYSAALTNDGGLVLAVAPVGYGQPVALGAVMGPPLVSGVPERIRIDVTSGTVTVTRLRTRQVLGPFPDRTWRGDTIWIGGSGGRFTVTGVELSAFGH